MQQVQSVNHFTLVRWGRRGEHTSKNGAELLPAGDSTLRGELTQRNLQEEDRQTPAKQEDEVGDEKCTCVEGRKDGATAGSRRTDGQREGMLKMERGNLRRRTGERT